MTDGTKHFEEEIWFSSVDEQQLAKYDKEAAFALFRERVAGQQKKVGALPRKHWLRYAAAIAMLVAVSYFSFRGGQEHVTAALGDIVVEAPQGSRTQMMLPDGSKVWLNAGSRISYPQGFGYTVRLVRLVGEGYFEVARNERLPFSVSSDHVQVKVLGTKFNFRDYPADAEAIVSLAEGSVAMWSSRKDEEVYLKPNQRASVNKRTGSICVEEYEVANATQWTNGRLIFDGEPLQEIVNNLERSYNVKIDIADQELLKLRFHGDFLRQEQTLNEVLDALAATGKIRYRRNGKDVTLY